MAASVLIATLFLFFSGSEANQQVGEPLAEVPAVQKLFIEVYVEPIIVEDVQIAIDGPAGVVENRVNDTPAEIREPIGTDVEPLDQIEPLFVEEVADQIAPVAEPVAEPVQIVEPVVVAVPEAAPEAVADAEQKAVAEPVAVPSAETTGAAILDVAPSDAIAPMINENAEDKPVPQAEATAETLVSPSVETTEPAQSTADALEIVEPVTVEPVAVAPAAVAPVAVAPVAVEPGTVEPGTAEPVTAEPIVEEKTATLPDASSNPFDGAASEPVTAANPPQVVEPGVVPEPQTAAGADQTAVDETISRSDADTGELDTDPFKVIEPAIDEAGGIETQPEEIAIPESSSLFDL